MSIDLSALHLNGRTVSLTLAEGRIAAITPVEGPARAVILPLPIDPHVHLDKTFTIQRCRASKPGLFGAIEAMAADVPDWTEADIRRRGGLALDEAQANGIRAMRSHVDWVQPAVPLAWSVLGELAQEWQSRLHLQRAALVPLDLLGDADLGPAIAALVARDADVLGSFVYGNTDQDAKLARVFALADRHGLRLDFHVDEGLDPEARGFDTIVALTARHKLAGRVLCGHACSLAIRPEAEVARVIEQAATAGVALSVLPATNLHLQDMQPGRSPRLRGLAPM
ncbi:MAG: amidohydrolase, partial [Paracoccaceae bacterium]|nr:amidohydrolase [Paracoccaceae bacterium]